MVKDTLDKNVTFIKPTTADGSVYDSKTHTVTWTIKNVSAGASGKVTLKVKVMTNAKTAGKVSNQANVKVGNDQVFATNTVSNPVSKTPSPNTGDDSHFGMWLTLLIISILGCGWFGLKAFRGKKTDKGKTQT